MRPGPPASLSRDVSPVHPLAVVSMFDVTMGQTTREKLHELIEDYGMGDYIAKALILRMTTDECRDFLSDLKWERV